MWNVETGTLLKKFTDQNSTTKVGLCCIVLLAFQYFKVLKYVFDHQYYGERLNVFNE